MECKTTWLGQYFLLSENIVLRPYYDDPEKIAVLDFIRVKITIVEGIQKKILEVLDKPITIESLSLSLTLNESIVSKEIADLSLKGMISRTR